MSGKLTVPVRVNARYCYGRNFEWFYRHYGTDTVTVRFNTAGISNVFIDITVLTRYGTVSFPLIRKVLYARNESLLCIRDS